MNNRKVINVWSKNTIVEPHQLRRYPLTFAAKMIVISALVIVLLLILLIGLPPAPSGASTAQIAKVVFKIVANKISSGLLWNEQAPKYLAAIHASPMAEWLKLKAALALICGSSLGWLIAKESLTPKTAYKHIRGAQLYDGKDAVKQLEKSIGGGTAEYIYPSVKVNEQAWGAGAVIVGSAGSGKTSILLPFIQKMKASGAKLLTLDAKNGEQIEKLGADVHYLAPWMKGSLIPDIGKDITNADEASAFADALIKKEQGAGKIWASAANAVFAALVEHLVRTKPLKWTWNDLAQILEQSSSEWVQIVANTRPDVLKVIDTAEQTQAGVLFNIATELRNLRGVADYFEEGLLHGGELFSVKDWLFKRNYDKRQVVLVFDAGREQLIGFLIPWLIDTIGMSITSLDQKTASKDRKYIFLDEFAQLPQINKLASYFEIGRSFGMRTIIATQDWSQVIKRYGKETAQTIFNNASVKVIAMTTIGDAQKSLAEWIGTHEVAHIAVNLSTNGQSHSGLSSSTSSQEKTMPLVLPSQLGSELGPIIPRGAKKPVAIRAILLPMGGDVFMLDFPFIDQPAIRKLPELLPSTHRLAALVNGAFNENPEATLAEKLRAAVKACNTKAKGELTAKWLVDFSLSKKLIDEQQHQEAMRIKPKEWINQMITKARAQVKIVQTATLPQSSEKQKVQISQEEKMEAIKKIAAHLNAQDRKLNDNDQIELIKKASPTPEVSDKKEVKVNKKQKIIEELM